PDGAALYFVADEQGHAPTYRLDVADGSITRLTASGAYSDLVVAPDGSALYALRSAVDSPPRPVRLNPALSDQDPVPLPAPGDVDRVRPGLHPARLGGVGRPALHRPDGGHRRRRGAPGHRPGPDGGDGRQLRRLHGELGGHPDRPVPGHRHAREPVAPGPVRRHDRPLLLLVQGDGRPAVPARTLRGELAALAGPLDPHADAGDPR